MVFVFGNFLMCFIHWLEAIDCWLHWWITVDDCCFLWDLGFPGCSLKNTWHWHCRCNKMAASRGPSSDAEISTAIGPERWGLQICDLMWSWIFFKFLSNDYTNPNTNPRTLTALNLTLTDPHGAFESFCAPILCDFIRNYYVRTRTL